MCQVSILSLQRLAGYPETPYEDIFYLAQHESEIVRTAVAARAGLESDARAYCLLYQLARDTHWGVRMAIVNRPILPADIAYSLTVDDNPGVRTLARRRVGLPEEVPAEGR